MLAFDVLRAIEDVDAHEVAFDVIEARLDGVDHPALSDLATRLAAERDGLEESLEFLLDADRDYRELHAKRFADYLFDVYVGTLLVSEAATHIDERGDGRKALVARRFVDEYLRERDNRGITADDRLPDEAYDAIVRFGSVPPEDLEAAPAPTAD
jgi:acyl-CoA dehydrogenase